jgi:ADP-ribosylglycohydrolase
MYTVLSLRDRVLGCLLGGALGDAWGGPHENRTGPLRFEIPSRPVLSDDTQLTMATCESILASRGVNPERLASHFLLWFKQGRIDGIGRSTLKAMQSLDAGAHWALAGHRGEYAAGNGAAMRVAPLAFVLDPAIPAERTLLHDTCRITHSNDEAYIGALAVLLAIRSIVSGGWSPQTSFLEVVADAIPDSAVRDRVRELLPLKVPPAEVAKRFGSSGYVVDTVPLALYCAQEIATDSLATVLAETISVGGDTDTVASITGQVCGCLVGRVGISEEHVDDIVGSQELRRLAVEYAYFVESEVGSRPK